MHGAVCNTEIMVLFIMLNSHFYTNQYKLVHNYYHMFHKKSNIEPIHYYLKVIL